MHCYAHLLAHHPYIVIAAVTVFAGTCLVVPLTLHKLPDFQDPQLGFESRGTVLAQRLTAWENLLEATKPSGSLTVNPLEEKRVAAFFHSFGQTTVLPQTEPQNITRSSTLKVDVEDMENYGIVAEKDYGNKSWSQNLDWIRSSPDTNNKWIELGKMNNGHMEDPASVPQSVSVPGFFCGEPLKDYAHVVFQSVVGESLFTTQAIRSMCEIENTRLRTVRHFKELCEITNKKKCCKSWSLGNYITLLSNKTSCKAIQDEDVSSVLEILRFCAKYYYNLELKSDCQENEKTCHGVPEQCMIHNAVYNILHFLADFKFLNPEHQNSTHLTYAAVFLPVASSSKALAYFRSLESMQLSDGVTEIAGMDMGLKFTLFNEYLVHDTVFIGLAGSLILLFMWMYTSSLFITLMTIIAIIFSLGISYFLYTLIFRIKFFPFMNLLTSIIIIGIGADDAFIYCKVWASAKSERNNGTMVKLVNDTLKHATLSMFVTSLTTAAAFYSSYVSSITAIRCFSIFAGTTILANFLLMVTWLPATVVFAEKWCSSNCCICIPPFGLYAPQLQHYPYCSKLCNALWKLHYHFTDWARIFFEKILPCIVIKPRYLWITILGGIAACGMIAVFYYPKLQLPDSAEFQILSADHPFEKYDLVLKDMFWFEKVQKADILSKLPLQIVWGVKPVDNGDYMDPWDKGTLIFDETFNVAKPESQKWLLNFCRQLRTQEFYQNTLGPLLPNCFIETFKSWMDRKCIDTVSNQDRSPCCEKSRFPYAEDVFNKCIHQAIKALYETPTLYFIPGVAGPRYSKETGNIKAIVIQYDSTYSYSMSYSHMHKFVTNVETWMKSMLSTAPPEMKNGWFISGLSFYDLQNSLSEGTVIAIGVSMGIAFIVLFLTTLNLLISIYAILTITCIIFVTIGALVLLGWKLNILESITVTVAIGLAVDFTLHYGVIYKLSAEDDRESAVIASISRMGNPIAMAAFTTFLAGLFMLPSSVLGYIQIGTFIMIVMTTSWIYATFFFQSLLRLIGPEKQFGQFHYPSFNCCASPPTHVDKTVYNYALSESTLSTSSTSYPTQTNANESHELEPLTVNPKGEWPKSGHKYIKHKSHCKSPRQRSGSLSVTFSERDPSLSSLVSKSPRKISLPTGTIDPSPKHVSGATSSTTIVFCDEERDQVIIPNKSPNVPDVWLRRTEEI